MKIYLLLTTLLLSMTLTAEEKSNVEEKKPVQKQEATNSKPSGSRSHQLREGKSWRFLAGFGYQYSEGGLHLSFGKFLNKDSIIEMEVFYSDDEDEGINVKEEETVGVAVNFQQFLGNTFFIKPGIFYGNHKSFRPEGTGFLSPSAADQHRSDIGIQFNIGNQWQWRNFTLGCEWFGYQRGVARLKKEGSESSFFSDGKDDKEWNTFTILKLSLGASF